MTALFRVTIDYFLLLPLGGLIALLWANAAPESYFALATNVRFVVNDVAMALFFGLIAQEVTEAVLPGGALHNWRRWLLPMLAAAGSLIGAALVYLGYVSWHYEQVLRDGWPAAAAIDLAVAYVLVRSLFRRHPAVPFVILVAVVSNVVGLAVVASREPFAHVGSSGVALFLFALLLSMLMRGLGVR